MRNSDARLRNEVIEDAVPNPPARRKRRRFIPIVLGIVFLLILIAGVGYYWYTTTETYQQKQVTKETEDLIKAVGKLMILPAGEPAIFVVQDPQLLASQQAFFDGAEQGDKLLVYSEAGKAVIYSPSRNLIVNVGPVTFDSPATPVPGTVTNTQESVNEEPVITNVSEAEVPVPEVDAETSTNTEVTE